jgi:hypothetical protein
VWLDKQWSSEAPIAAPKFEDLFDKIKLRMNWEIPMPAKGSLAARLDLVASI